MSPWIILLLFIGILIFFFFMGVPVGFSLGLTSVVLMLIGVAGNLSIELIVSRVYAGVDSFILLAVPFFFFAGQLMNSGGITRRIFRFCCALVAGVRGALFHVNVIASMIFAGMSGAALADAAGLGAIEIKAMTEEGYPWDLSVGVTAASSTIGPIIPPSIPLVVYAIMAGMSPGAMLLSGIIPGVLIGACLIVVSLYYAKKAGMVPTKKFSGRELADSFKDSFLALLTPVILIGGIISGLFTVTEAAAMAVLYAFILVMFIYKELSWKELWDILKKTAVDSSMVTFLVALGALYGFLTIKTRVPILLAEVLLGVTTNKYFILLLLNVFLLIVGLFMETLAALTILTPILVPVIIQAGIDPVHFGVVMVFNLMIGLLTPPFGAVLFVLQKVTNRPFTDVCRASVKYYPPLFIALIILTLCPWLVTFIPGLLKF